MTLSREARLESCPEVRVGLGIPSPLSGRLDILVELANRGGARTSRKEVMAALILAAPETEEGLAELVRGYRLAAVKDALIPGEDEAPMLDPAPPGPGPRRSRRAP